MRRWSMLLAGALLAAIAFWAFAQPAPQQLSTLFPAGPLLYLEAKDFGSLLADWNGSAEKRAWLGASNYQAFSRSRLFLKLGQAQAEFAVAAGVPPDYALLGSVAGSNSALGIYAIGNLEFLYITHLPSARALDTALWKTRGSYQTRRAGNVDYYVRQDLTSHRAAAFAYVGDTLMLATREDLVSGALELLARQARPSLASEKWFTDSIQAAQPGANDLRLVYNLERLLATPHFRSYWVQRNVSALREFTSGIADLERARGEIQERRVLLRANPSAAISDETATGQLLALVPDDAGLYRAWLRPPADQASRWIEEKLFAAIASPGAASKRAPAVMIASDAGSEQDLETRIDEPPLVDDRTARAFAPLRDRLTSMPIQAMLEVVSTQGTADQVFIASQSALVLLSANPWDAGRVRAVFTSAAGSLWSDADLGVTWRASANPGVQELDGLGKLALAVDGRWLIVGDSVDLVNSLFSRRNRQPLAGAVYSAGWRHARELPNFERMMRLIDFPQIPPPSPGQTGADAREPMFYSENVASLGRALQRVQSASIAVHDTGPMLRESVVYRIAP